MAELETSIEDIGLKTQIHLTKCAELLKGKVRNLFSKSANETRLVCFSTVVSLQ